MTAITGYGGLAATRPTMGRRPGAASGFRVPDAEAAETAPLLAVSMPSLLGLQEAQGDAVSDREARRHADEMLDTLKDMQRELLGAATGGGSAARLALLARRAPLAADPGLAAVQKALALRAAVETARHKAAASV